MYFIQLSWRSKSRNIFLVSVHPQVTWSTATCSKLWEVWELPLSVPFVFAALPLRVKSNGMDYFGLWEGLPSPWWGHGKQPSSSGYHSNIFDWLFSVQLWIIMMYRHVNFLFPVSFRYIHILWRSKSMEILSVLVHVHLQVTWSASHTPTCSKLWEMWELLLSIPCVFVDLPLVGGCSNKMDYFHGEIMENRQRQMWNCLCKRDTRKI